MKRLILMTALLAACDDDLETCETAIPTFYADGCTAYDGNAIAIDETAALAACRADEARVSDRCRESTWQPYVDCLASRADDANFGCDICHEVRKSWRWCEEE